MSVKFKDYYNTLELSRTAKADEIKKAYRKLARKHHPDVNKAAEAEAKFKEITEAYEVLSDSDKRKKYDELGSNWKNGQNFKAPPGHENFTYEYHGPDSSRTYTYNDMGGNFSDFFESLFGHPENKSKTHFKNTSGMGGIPPIQGQDHEANIEISLQEAYHGTQQTLSYQMTDIAPDGTIKPEVRQFDVRIPPGTTNGSRIRLKGKGGHGYNGGSSGDLYMRVQIREDIKFRVQKFNLETDIMITPWDAALGTTVSISTMSGKTAIKLRPGTQSGQRMRLPGKGLPKGKEGYGDLFIVVKIVIPKKLSNEEKKLFEQLARVSTFKPE